MKRLWQRCTGTLFGRLALLLLGTALISHVLALTLVFRILPGPPAGPGAPAAVGSMAPGTWPDDGLDDGDAFADEAADETADALANAPAPPPRPGLPSWGMLADVAIRLGAIVLAAWVAARWLVRPMQRLTQAAQALGHDIDRPPMPEEGPLEVREATRIFNQMQARIRAQISDRDRFVAAVSHDLRTPLTRLRLRAEGLADGEERDKFRRDLVEMEQMIAVTLDHLRGTASAEALALLDVEALAHTVAEDLQDQGHSVTVHGRARPLQAQPSALRRCLDNLVDNAIRYGRCADLHLMDGPEALRIEVRDRGPGLPEAELARVLAPFYRVEGSRNRAHGGVGLGLSIAQDIARRHGGSLVLRNAEGGGLAATLTLPRSAL